MVQLTRTRLSNIIDIAYMLVIGLIIVFFISNYLHQTQEEQREVRQFIERQNVTHIIIEQNEQILCLEQEILKQLDNRIGYQHALDDDDNIITSCV